MAEEMKNVAICHEEALTTTLVILEEKLELVMECLKKVEQKFLDV
jgi:hypothetical protein